MAIRLAAILVPVFLAFIGLGAVAFSEYQRQKLGAQTFDTQELGPIEYIRARYAAFQEKRAVKAVLRDMSISKALPPAPAGWTRAAYEIAHGEAITGVTFEPSATVKDTEQSIQDAFRLVQREKHLGAVASYINETQIVALKIRQVEMPETTTLEGGLALRISAVGDALEAPENQWGIIGGTQYLLKPQLSKNDLSQDERPVSYRRIEGNFGALFDIFVFTNADDAAVNAVLEGIDYALLEDYVHATLMAQQHANPPAATQRADGEVADTDDGAFLPSQADDAALQQETADPEEGARAASFLKKLGELFATNGAAGKAEEEERRRMVCTVQQGFKRCAFPKEDD